MTPFPHESRDWLKIVRLGPSQPCLHELLAIVTHPKIYAPPTPLAAAVEQIEAWLESPTVTLLAESEGYWPELIAILGDGRIAGPQVHDARVAALCTPPRRA